MDRVPDTHNVFDLTDIMHPHDIRAAGDSGAHRRGRSPTPLGNPCIKDLADKPLAGHAHEDRPAEHFQLGKLLKDLRIMDQGLAETDARVDYYSILPNATIKCFFY